MVAIKQQITYYKLYFVYLALLLVS